MPRHVWFVTGTAHKKTGKTEFAILVLVLSQQLLGRFRFSLIFLSFKGMNPYPLRFLKLKCHLRLYQLPKLIFFVIQLRTSFFSRITPTYTMVYLYNILLYIII